MWQFVGQICIMMTTLQPLSIWLVWVFWAHLKVVRKVYHHNLQEMSHMLRDAPDVEEYFFCCCRQMKHETWQISCHERKIKLCHALINLWKTVIFSPHWHFLWPWGSLFSLWGKQVNKLPFSFLWCFKIDVVFFWQLKGRISFVFLNVHEPFFLSLCLSIPLWCPEKVSVHQKNMGSIPSSLQNFHNLKTPGGKTLFWKNKNPPLLIWINLWQIFYYFFGQAICFVSAVLQPTSPISGALRPPDARM